MDINEIFQEVLVKNRWLHFGGDLDHHMDPGILKNHISSVRGVGP